MYHHDTDTFYNDGKLLFSKHDLENVLALYVNVPRGPRVAHGVQFTPRFPQRSATVPRRPKMTRGAPLRNTGHSAAEHWSYRKPGIDALGHFQTEQES